MKISKTLFSLIALISSLFSLAQAPPPPPATPVDGGLGLLLVGGVAYGIKMIRDKRNI